MADFETCVCAPADRHAALDMLYSHLSADERALHIVDFENNKQKLHEGLLVCKRFGQVEGAIFCLSSPGRTVMVWPPVVASAGELDSQIRIYSQLMIEMRRFAVRNRARLVQTLLADEEKPLEPIFKGSGFFYLTRLLYLHRTIEHGPLPPVSSAVEFVPYREELHNEFLNTLDQSYIDSLDCPEINGVRELQDIFESHRAQGIFQPENWLLARVDGQWGGCLLMVGLPEMAALEVAYVSVLPAMRGKGLGRELTRKALHLARLAGVSQVTLAVDERNLPARRVYESEQFEQWESRHAYLLILDPADGKFRRIPTNTSPA